MLRATRRLWGILPAITGRSTGAAAACDAVLSRPLAVEDCRRHSSVIGAQNAETEPVDESWWREVQGAADGSSGSGGGAEQHPQQQHSRQTRYSNTRLEAPIDAPRALRDYQKMVLALSRRRRAYLIRDVVDEMSLSGIRPDRFILTTGLFACMKNRKLGDAMHFFEEMKRRGLQPNEAAYSHIISACGRAGQLAKAVELRDEMLQLGLPLTHNIQLALLHAFAEAGRMRQAREVFDQICAAGSPADEFAFAGLINCYRHMSSKGLPADAEQQLEGLLAQFKEARAAADAAAQEAAETEGQEGGHSAEGGYSQQRQQQQPQRGAVHYLTQQALDAEERPPINPLLVVFNAVLNGMVELGFHDTARAMYASMAEEQGLAPDHTTYSNIIRCHLQQALGRHRQPARDRLTAILDEMLEGVDLQADVEAVLAEDHALSAALQAAAAAEAAAAVSQEQQAGGEPAGAPQEGGGVALLDEDMEDEAEALPGVASFLLINSKRGGSEGGGPGEDGLEEEEEGGRVAVPLVADARRPGSGSSRQGPARGRHQGTWARMSEQQLRQVVQDRAANRARSRLRFEVFRQYLDLEAWYEALHLFQEVLDQGLVWGPDITYTMIKASLDLQAAGVEDALAVAHTVMDTFERQGLFIDVENGTEVLLLAVRRDVGDLSLAHRVYDSMRKTQRVPKTPCMFKYMRAMASREPDNKERLLELCGNIMSDPDRSDRVAAMKTEAFKRRQVLMSKRR